MRPVNKAVKNNMYRIQSISFRVTRKRKNLCRVPDGCPLALTGGSSAQYSRTSACKCGGKLPKDSRERELCNAGIGSEAAL